MKGKSPTQLKKEIYLRNVAKRWKSELFTNKKVYILSPYITSKTAENVLESVRNCEIYTVFNIENFLNGASSIRTLKKLIKKGFKVYDIPQLHSKIILVAESFVSIGSQNLTNQGTRNKEATFTSTSSEVVKFVENQLKENWFIYRKSISLEMIEDAEKEIRPLKKLFKKLKNKVKEVEDFVFEQENHREVARKKKIEEERKRKESRYKFIKNLREIRKTKEYVQGSVRPSNDYNRWTFISSSNPDLLNWRIGLQKFSLKKEHFRYLSLIANTGKLGWSRVNKTCITYFGDAVFHGNVFLNNKNYSLSLQANWDLKSLPDYNLTITLSDLFPKYLNYSLDVLFDLRGINIHKDKFIGTDDGLPTWIDKNTSEFEKFIIPIILQPFLYKKKLFGVEANNFLEKWKKYIIRLGELNTQPFLIFTNA